MIEDSLQHSLMARGDSAVTAATAGGLWVGHGSWGSTGASWQEVT